MQRDWNEVLSWGLRQEMGLGFVADRWDAGVELGLEFPKTGHVGTKEANDTVFNKLETGQTLLCLCDKVTGNASVVGVAAGAAVII